MTVIFMQVDQHFLACFRNTAVAEAVQARHAHSPAANSSHSSAEDISVFIPSPPNPPLLSGHECFCSKALQSTAQLQSSNMRALHGHSLGLWCSACTLFSRSFFPVITKMSAQNCMAEFQFIFSSVEDDCGSLKVHLISKQPRKSKCN